MRKLVGVAVGVFLAFRLLRRLRIFVEVYVHHHLPKHVHPELAPQAGATTPATGDTPPSERRQSLEDTIRRWFTLVERFALVLTVIGGLWLAGRIVGFSDADGWASLVLKVVTYF